MIKSAHPDWSPAAIKSAIVTTADVVNLKGNPILDSDLLPAKFIAIGAGHVNPSKASDLRLVYDIHPDEYVNYLCDLNLTDTEIGMITQHYIQ